MATDSVGFLSWIGRSISVRELSSIFSRLNPFAQLPVPRTKKDWPSISHSEPTPNGLISCALRIVGFGNSHIL
jgi:hypothetical protein